MSFAMPVARIGTMARPPSPNAPAMRRSSASERSTGGELDPELEPFVIRPDTRSRIAPPLVVDLARELDPRICHHA
jgi:hypothetical protein